MWPHAVMVFGCYLVTLSIFPGFLAEDVSSERLGGWYPVLLFTAFNAADLVGKMLPLVAPVTHVRALGGLCGGRVVFVPLFVLVAFGPPRMREEPMVFLLTVHLGFTNGYLTGNCFEAAPQCCPRHLQESAGMIMVLSLVGGLAAGAACGFLWLL
mmetsp:Transcript_60116/g.190969  ORF Transcript_60116/g.190969 Transcript_60116/m.190969 type:complete len:155 (+) Transcript_60116:90-554(+)